MSNQHVQAQQQQTYSIPVNTKKFKKRLRPNQLIFTIHTMEN